MVDVRRIYSLSLSFILTMSARIFTSCASEFQYSLQGVTQSTCDHGGIDVATLHGSGRPRRVFSRRKGFAFCSCVMALLCLGIPFTAAVLVVLGFDGRDTFSVTDGLLNVATEQAYWVTSHRHVDLLTRGRFTVSPISRPIDSAQPPFLAFQGDWMTDRMRQGTVTTYQVSTGRLVFRILSFTEFGLYHYQLARNKRTRRTKVRASSPRGAYIG
jgi:hypothetical protein